MFDNDYENHCLHNLLLYMSCFTENEALLEIIGAAAVFQLIFFGKGSCNFSGGRTK